MANGDYEDDEKKLTESGGKFTKQMMCLAHGKRCVECGIMEDGVTVYRDIYGSLCRFSPGPKKQDQSLKEGR